MLNEHMIYDYVYNLIWCGALTIVAATMMYAVWKFVSKRLQNHPHISYWSLKIVIVIVPFVGLYLLNHYFLIFQNLVVPIYQGTIHEFSFSYIAPAVQDAEWAVYSVAGIWLLASIRYAINPIREKYRLMQLHRYSEPSKVLSATLKQLKTEFGIRKRIEIYTNDQVKSPMVFRLFGYKIWIPEDTYAEDDLEVMILHELNHIVHKDLLYKAIICNLQVTLPVPILWNKLKTDYDNYSETTCDIAVCERVVDAYGYFTLIFNLLMAKTKQKYQFHNISEMAKKGNNLVFRMDSFERYEDRDVTTDKPVKRSTFGKLIILGCALTAFVTIMNFGYAKAYDWFYEDVDTNIPNEEMSAEVKLDLQELGLEGIDLKNAKTLEWDETVDDYIFAIDNGMLEGNCVYVSEVINIQDKENAMIACSSLDAKSQLMLVILKNGCCFEKQTFRGNDYSMIEIEQQGCYQIILCNYKTDISNFDIGLVKE